MSGSLRAVELTDRRDDGARDERLLAARRPRGSRTRHAPASVVPAARATTSVSQRTCGVDAVALHHVGEVALQLGLLREVLAPVVARLERVAVEVVADVDAAPGVGVLVPGAADAGVLLDDRERDARLLQPDAGEQPRLPAADDDDGERRARRPRRRRGRPRARRRRRAPSPRASSGRTPRARPGRRASSSSPG